MAILGELLKYQPLLNVSNHDEHEVYDRLLTGPTVDFQ
jgi:hypothetical protein